MTERYLALALSALVAAACLFTRRPDGPAPSWWPQDRVEIVERIRIVYVCPEGYVCFPAKDESRHVNTGIVPRLVKTEIIAADIPPAVQAQETQHKKKPNKR